MKIEHVPISKLKPYANNPKKHPEEQINKIAQSIKEFGFINPVIVDRDNEVIAGHGRLLACQKLGITKVPVIRAEHLTPEQVRAYRIADNRLTELGGWDMELVRVELSALAELDFDIDLTGFDFGELEELLETFTPPEPRADEDEVPELEEEPFTKPGDLWEVGAHRLLCGDVLNKEDLETLMQGAEADMVFTDPPYNVNYSGRGKTTSRTIKNDSMDIQSFEGFLREAFRNLSAYAVSGCPIYICHADQKPMVRATFEIVFNEFFVQSATIIWVKNNASMGWQDYRSQHEPILYGWKEGRHEFYGDRGETTVWEIAREALAKYVHPTQKPVALIERAILNSTVPGQIVLDGFAGSGTTLIACEKTGRKARLMEIEPYYCDVIMKRYIQYTDKRDIYLNRDGKRLSLSELGWNAD